MGSMSAAVMPVSSTSSRRAHSISLSSPSTCPFGKSQRSACRMSRNSRIGSPRTIRKPQDLTLVMRWLFRQLEIGDEKLAAVVRRPHTGPHQLRAVGRERGQNVGSFKLGDSNGRAEQELALKLIVRQPEIVVGPGRWIRMVSPGPDDELPLGVPIRAPIHALRVGELRFILAVDTD